MRKRYKPLWIPEEEYEELSRLKKKIEKRRRYYTWEMFLRDLMRILKKY